MARSNLSLSFALATATLILFAGAIPASAQPAASPRQREIDRELVEAIQLLQTKGMPDAIKKLDEATARYPELPSSHVLMYDLLLRFNRPSLARQELNEAVLASPGDPEPYIILCDIALQDRRLAEAALCIDKANQLLTAYKGTASRKLVLERLALGDSAHLAEARDNWRQAEPILRNLLKLSPEDLTAHQRLARSLFWQGSRQKIIEAYDVLKRAKEIDLAIFKRNHTRESLLAPEAIMGKFIDELEGPTSPNSKKWFDDALNRYPRDLATRRFVAKWALDNGKLDFAKQQVEAILKIEQSDNAQYGGSTSGHMLRGMVALWEKRWADAEKDFQTVLLQAQDDFAAKNNITLALVEQEDEAKKRHALAYAFDNYREQRKRHLDKDIDAKYPEALSTLIWASFKCKQFDEAENTINTYGREFGDPSDPDTLTYIAYFKNRRDINWAAKALLEKALSAGRPFSMKPEALKLYEKVKDAKRPGPAAAERTP